MGTERCAPADSRPAPAPLLEVADLFAVVVGPVKGGLVDLIVRDGDIEAAAEMAQLLFVELFLLVGDIAALTGFAQAIALDGLGQNHRGRPLVLHGRLIGGIHL
jgi:hypothetical protein